MGMSVREARIVIFCNGTARRPVEIAARFEYSLSWTYGTLGIMEYKGYLKKISVNRRSAYKTTNPEIYAEAVSTMEGYNNALGNNTPESKTNEDFQSEEGKEIFESNRDSQESKEQ